MGRAIAALTEALELGEAGLPADSAAIRALAVAGNNLAVALEERAVRSAFETRAMIVAAEAGLPYWTQAGAWLEAERAEYRLARSLLQSGQAQAATSHARRCLDLCEQHSAAPFERFFGHAVLALAHRALGCNADFEMHRQSAIRQLARVEEADRAACDTTQAELAD